MRLDIACNNPDKQMKQQLQPRCPICRKPMLARERLALTGDGVTVVHKECPKGGKG